MAFKSTSSEHDGKPLSNFLESDKRQLFLIATPAGILSMLIVWGVGLSQKTLLLWDFIALPLLGLVFLVLSILLWRRKIRLNTYELVVYTLVVVYAIVEFYFVLSQTIITQGSFNSNFTLWIPFTYLLAFLILDVNRALFFSTLYLFAILAVGVTCLVRFSLNGIHFQNVSLLIQIYLASAFYVLVLFIMARSYARALSENSAVDAMSKLAMTDSLTKVDNRRLLDKLIRDEIHRVERSSAPLSVLLMDLDYFKKINDNFGHNTGDAVLQEVAELLRQNTRSSDPFGRWGGDEFLCLATNTDELQATELAERLRDALQRKQFPKVGGLTASFGVTTYQLGDTPETLVRRADMGLYKAKASGRNRVEVVSAGVTLPLFEGEKPYPNIESEAD
jgi:diguanylate cyclase (GGDEF)-like protein